MSRTLNPIRSRRTAAALALSLAGLILAALPGCGPKPLPEQNSYAAEVYSSRCDGKCHKLYEPGSLTAAMWEFQIAKMRQKMREAQVPALSADEERVILDYLTRNASQQ